jgi:hypothetical protein
MMTPLSALNIFALNPPLDGTELDQKRLFDLGSGPHIKAASSSAEPWAEAD